MGIVIVLAVMVALLCGPQAHAEVWRCHQANGADFITAGEQNPGACETFRMPERPRLYDPNRYFPEFYYNYYPGPQALLSQSFPYHQRPPVQYVPPPAPQHTLPRIMPLLKR